MKYIAKNKWIRNVHLDKIENRIQLGFFRCPLCNEYIGMYSDEFSKNSGESFHGIKCSKSTCDFFDSVKLEKW